jgi:hypothetical protein
VGFHGFNNWVVLPLKHKNLELQYWFPGRAFFVVTAIFSLHLDWYHKKIPIRATHFAGPGNKEGKRAER